MTPKESARLSVRLAPQNNLVVAITGICPSEALSRGADNYYLASPWFVVDREATLCRDPWNPLDRTKAPIPTQANPFFSDGWQNSGISRPHSKVFTPVSITVSTLSTDSLPFPTLGPVMLGGKWRLMPHFLVISAPAKRISQQLESSRWRISCPVILSTAGRKPLAYIIHRWDTRFVRKEPGERIQRYIRLPSPPQQRAQALLSPSHERILPLKRA